MRQLATVWKLFRFMFWAALPEVLREAGLFFGVPSARRSSRAAFTATPDRASRDSPDDFVPGPDSGSCSSDPLWV